MKKYFLPASLLLFILALIEGCSYKNTDDVYVQPDQVEIWDTACLGSPDTFGYAATIKPIVEANCATNSNCHAGNSSYPPNFTTHAGFAEWTKPGNPRGSRIREVISSGYMPLNNGPLSDCDQKKISQWIELGSKDD